jgi:hypothetical protein
LTVRGAIPNFSAISLMVKPSIYIISEIIQKSLKKVSNSQHFYLTKCLDIDTLINIGWLPMAEERN